MNPNKKMGKVDATTEPIHKVISAPKFNGQSNDTKAQHVRMLEGLARRPHTTEMFRKIGIFQCATRVSELRAMGHQILTSRITTVDRDGYVHFRSGLYSLVSEPEGVQ